MQLETCNGLLQSEFAVLKCTPHYKWSKAQFIDSEKQKHKKRQKNKTEAHFLMLLQVNKKIPGPTFLVADNQPFMVQHLNNLSSSSTSS